MRKKTTAKKPHPHEHTPQLSTIVNAIEWQKTELIRLRSVATVARYQEVALKHALSSPMIKIVLGPRRAGKSMLCIRVLADKNHAYLNFDDDQIALVKDSTLLIQALEIVYPNTKLLLFDEIQNFDGWELLVSKLQRAGYNILLTGSNAHLLSGELASSLTGRHIPIELLPLSFSEILKVQATSQEKDQELLSQYLKHGGFPEPLLTEIDTNNYLRTLFESVLYKDIVKRYRLRNPQHISSIGYFLANNIASLVAVEKLGKSLGIGSTATTQKLLGYLEQTFLFFLMQSYSFKVREQIRLPRKCYVIDPGFASALSKSKLAQEGRAIENVVLIDLMQRGYVVNRSCFYYRTRNYHEVDFLLKPDRGADQLIQACLSLSDPGTREREVRSLIEASKELKCKKLVIVTRNERETIEFDGGEVEVYELKQWLSRIN